MSNDDGRQPAELRQFLERHPDTRTRSFCRPDMLGILRGKRVGRDEFAKVFGIGVNFCGATVLLDSKGQTFERIADGSRDGDPDAISTAVPGSLAPVPWAQVPTAQVLLAMATAKGEPFFADPRQVLRHAAKPLQELGCLHCRCSNGAGVRSARSGQRPAHAEGGTHTRDAPRAGWAAVRLHGGRRRCRRFPVRSCTRSARRRTFPRAPR